MIADQGFGDVSTRRVVRSRSWISANGYSLPSRVPHVGVGCVAFSRIPFGFVTNKAVKLLKTQATCPESDKTIPMPGLGHITVSPIPSSALDRRARRPRNSRLANTRLEALGLGLLPPWKDAVRSYLSRAKGVKDRCDEPPWR